VVIQEEYDGTLTTVVVEEKWKIVQFWVCF
jgi:hypothetical protein